MAKSISAAKRIIRAAGTLATAGLIGTALTGYVPTSAETSLQHGASDAAAVVRVVASTTHTGNSGCIHITFKKWESDFWTSKTSFKVTNTCSSSKRVKPWIEDLSTRHSGWSSCHTIGARKSYSWATRNEYWATRAGSNYTHQWATC